MLDIYKLWLTLRHCAWFAGYFAVAEYWDDLWRPLFGDMPHGIVRDCCAQFAVTRPALLRYSKVGCSEIDFDLMFSITPCGKLPADASWLGATTRNRSGIINLLHRTGCDCCLKSHCAMHNALEGCMKTAGVVHRSTL